MKGREAMTAGEIVVPEIAYIPDVTPEQRQKAARTLCQIAVRHDIGVDEIREAFDALGIGGRL